MRLVTVGEPNEEARAVDQIGARCITSEAEAEHPGSAQVAVTSDFHQRRGPAGTTPLVATAIVAASGGQPWGVAAMITAASLMTLVGVLIAKPWISAEEKATTPALAGLATRSD